MTSEQAQKRAEELAARCCHSDSVDELVFEKGYLAAYHDLAPKIEKLVKTLEWYATEKEWRNDFVGLEARDVYSSDNFVNIHCPAREALEELEK